MLVAIGTIDVTQSKGTEARAKAATHLFNYCATHPNVTICYDASDMIMKVHSNSSYLSEK
eukprot:446655-Ditylum_brightwellii.AAC.1